MITFLRLITTVFLSIPAVIPSVVSAELVGELKEEYNSESPVFGREMRGIWLGNPADTVKLGGISAYIPEPYIDSKICFQALTRDALYRVSGHLTLNKSIGLTPYRIKGYEKSEYINLLSKYKQIDFAPLFFVSPDCSNPEALLVASTSKTRGPYLNFAFNTRGGTVLGATLINTAIPNSVKDAQCQSSSAARQVAFDVICSFDFSVDSSQDKSIELQVSLRSKPRGAPIRIDDFSVRLK